MKHLLKKLSIAGGGGSRKPKPPIYKPPVMGELQYGASYSFAETLDLISDGPIEGLVNANGETVDGLKMLQGIYLDDTAVAVTTDSPRELDQLTTLETETIETLNMELDSTKGVTYCSKFFQELQEADLRSSDGRITDLNSSTAGGLDNEEASSASDVTMVFLRSALTDNVYPRGEFDEGRGIATEPREPLLPSTIFDYAAYIRGFVKYRGSAGAETFEWYLNGEKQTGYNDANAAFRDDSRPKGTLGSLLWADTNLNSSKFFFSFQPDLRYRYEGRPDGDDWVRANGTVFDQNEQKINEVVFSELDTIYGLYANNNQQGGNDIQQELALRALNRLGFNGSNTNTLITDYLNPEEYGGVIIVKTENTNSNLNKSILDGADLFNMTTFPVGLQNQFNLIAVMQNAGMRVTDVTCPEIDTSGTLTGVMHGFLIIEFPIQEDTVALTVRTAHGNDYPYGYAYSYQVPREVISALSDLNSFKYAKTLEITETLVSQDVTINDFNTTNLKYNYSNVLAELKKGTESQNPFRFFSRVFIDHMYDRELFGPFGTAKADGNPNTVGAQSNAPQRIMPNSSMLTRESVLGETATNYNTDLVESLPLNEGSDDQRKDARAITRNYSDWGENSLAAFDERAIPVVHTIYNPNVDQVFITLDITELKDTLIKDVDGVRAGRGEDNKNISIGTTFPTVLNIQVETGKIGKKSDGSEGQVPFRTYTYRIVALIEGNTLIDIGNPDYQATSGREFVVELNGADDALNYLSQPFQLPETTTSKQSVLSADGERGVEAGTIEEDSTQKRYVKVTKLSYESNSVLLAKTVSVRKVTEIIGVDLPYPFSAIVGTKLDSRAFGSIPRRSFDCKLKKVRIPSNYFPVKKGVDKRYYANQELFDNTSKENKLVYKGDWDGSFNDELMWTDNPAWILYDLLTNSRYGMGSHIDSETINKWQLYKIGRFCDAVDDDGYFVGVTDGRGGKEPRFSCNIVFDQGQKIFDAINTIAALFKGRTFFSNSEINFVDDRPRDTVNLFTNESVKDGLFFYSNNRRDEQFNCIEVGYRDRFDNFSPKIEVVEDEEDIKERGIFKKKIEGIGITSRAMARRTAQHQIFSKIKENQQVAFTAGLESLLCKPGDLVIIEDELKTNKANFGKVLAVDLGAETLRLTNQFNSSSMDGVLTVYNPTGSDSYEDLNTIANSIRQRYYNFTVTGIATDSWFKYTGQYGFSGYTEGYTEATGLAETRFQQYAAYTGLPESGRMLYFQTGVTGWVFASGTGEGNASAINLNSGDFISEWTGTQTLADFNTGKIAAFNMPARTRGASSSFSGISSLTTYTRGITESEISEISPDQLSVLSVTGSITDQTYGSLVSGFDKPEILPFVKLGSPAKFEIKDASPFIYKVISMKEEAPNEYLVTATKYDTGKFNLIDKNISIEDKANTYSYQVAQTINGVTYKTLDAPSIDSVTTGVPNASDATFTITGDWSAVNNSTGYNMALTLPNGQVINNSITTTGGQFTGLNQVGVFNFSVNALGNNGGAGGNAYFDSDYASSGIFVLYEETLTFSKSFLDRITIL
tara:strand:+ start:1980 stop:6641 length:4662 start_codon:yes stop_codon:yes gene_type:complete